MFRFTYFCGNWNDVNSCQEDNVNIIQISSMNHVYFREGLMPYIIQIWFLKAFLPSLAHQSYVLKYCVLCMLSQVKQTYLPKMIKVFDKMHSLRREKSTLRKEHDNIHNTVESFPRFCFVVKTSAD